MWQSVSVHALVALDSECGRWPHIPSARQHGFTRTLKRRRPVRAKVALRVDYFFAPALRRSTQYFRILSAAVLLAAGDIRRRFRGDLAAAPFRVAVAVGAD